MNGISRVTNGVIKHRLLERARDEFVPLCRDATDGLAIVLVGPTQCGKSIVFREVVSLLRDSFKDQRPGALPIVDLQVESVSEGRAKPKWIGIELLKLLEHPMYKHIGSFEEDEHYFPSKGRDETTLRIALKEAFSRRFTRRTCLDEAHLLTKTKDADLRAAILESVKSTCAIDRSLIAVGGYEIAYKGLFDSAHFSGRVIPFDFGYYCASDPDDITCWLRILKTYSAKLELEPRTLLTDQALNLLHWNNGTLGLLDNHLWSCSVLAKARHQRIDMAILRARAQPEKAREAIALDIQLGKKALTPSPDLNASIRGSQQSVPMGSATTRESVPKQRRQPFERNPNRNPALEVTLHDED